MDGGGRVVSGEIAYLRPGGQALRGSEAVADRLRDLDSAGAVVADAQGRVGLAPNPLAPPEGHRILCYYPPLPPERLGSAAFRREFGTRFAISAAASDLGMAQALGEFGALASFAPPSRLPEAEMALARAQRAFGGRLFALRLKEDPLQPEAAEALADLWGRRGGRLLEAEGFAAPTPALALWRAETLARDAEGAPASLRRLVARVATPEAAEAFLRPAPAEILDRLVSRGKLDDQRRALALEIPMADAVTLCGGGPSSPWATAPLLARALRQRDRLCAPEAWPYLGVAGGAASPQAMAALFAMGADYAALDEAAAICAAGSPNARVAPDLEEGAEELRLWGYEAGLDLSAALDETLTHLLRAAALESRLNWLALSGAPLPRLHPPRPAYRPPP